MDHEDRTPGPPPQGATTDQRNTTSGTHVDSLDRDDRPGSDRQPQPGYAGSDDTHEDDSGSGGGMNISYWRFAAMIATSTVVMFGLMYLNTYAWDHVRWSETRAYMALVMGATMAVIMLGYMLNMYRDWRFNVGIAIAAVLVFSGALWLVRSQETVQERSYMRAMIPHHSIAILTSERSELNDIRVCELAVEIIEAQKREIAEMEWLIDDISENGSATTAADAEARAVPDFGGTAIRTCG